jgi:hypothetical protein
MKIALTVVGIGIIVYVFVVAPLYTGLTGKSIFPLNLLDKKD